jgi:phosphoribosylanthranilate isomerase
MIRVKICGLTDIAGTQAAAAAGADWIGFNFFAASPRFVRPAQAAALATHAPGIARVGLFIEAGDDEIAATLAMVPLHVLQIYADAPRAAAIRARFGRPVWRSVGVSDRSELPATTEGADALLIEAKPPPGATRPAGLGLSIDWSMLAGWTPAYPWLLAGGLTPDNVGAAIRLSGATAVDVSSGVEKTKGVKDPALVAAFIAAARAGNADPR